MFSPELSARKELPHKYKSTFLQVKLFDRSKAEDVGTRLLIKNKRFVFQHRSYAIRSGQCVTGKDFRPLSFTHYVRDVHYRHFKPQHNEDTQTEV